MRVLNLGKFRRARVWIGDLPDATYRPLNTVKCSMAANSNVADGPRLAAIELLVPQGAHSMYGMLGGEFEPDSGASFDVEVCLSSASEPVFANGLANQTDEVRMGLPSEYIEGVCSGIALAKGELDRLLAGKLRVNCAAHGAVGSCEAVFKHLAAILVKLFNLKNQVPSDSELIKLFPSTFD